MVCGATFRSGHVWCSKAYTTEAQRPEVEFFFPWPGDDGQGKEASGFAGTKVELK